MAPLTLAPLPAKPDFNDLAATFSHKSDREVKEAYWLFRLMNNPLLMKALTSASKLAMRLHLPVRSLIRGTVYKHFCGGESVEEALQVIDKLEDHHIAAVLDYAAEAQDKEEGYELALNHILHNITLAQKSTGIGAISVKMTGLGSFAIFEKLAAGLVLSDAEEQSYERTKMRLLTICELAADSDVNIYIDAEESWIQAPIDELTEEMMERFNMEDVLVFTSLQMYRTDRLEYLEDLLQRAEERGYQAGVKLVRGAYWEKERERAEKLSYTSPVYPTKAKTDESFNKAVIMCLERLPRVELCLATHNQESIQMVVREIQQRQLQAFIPYLHFSQLYGMSDNLTFAMARAGFNTSKYLPYGEVDKALPYLIRRAEENTAIAGQMGRELALLKEEMKRRKLN
ncbi:proline dehydrogenase family protein [Cesiribacter andamanensis]|uniref:Bifunctional protein putA n=1 Tax=Cesiribacter andamanensis AMV16 TaxID=1279009 RepID=M7N812_9BACT|nr:proline dehydrogenase family protein [Cesiribacter andamanensis]EMR03392.1 Bifunctional protein putA [Cesiribacter andamanensis AMV16]